MDFLQYVEMNSYLHKLDPRSKFSFFLSMAVITSIIRSGPALLLLFVFFVGIWSVSRIGRYILLLLRKMRVLISFIVVLWFVLGLFSVGQGHVLWSASFSFAGQTVRMSFEWYDIYKGVVLALRIFLMISCFYTVILTTNFSDIILGLRKWRVPYSVSFGIGLVFQIIPMIIGEFYAIMEAQSSRGLEVEKCGAIRKMKNYIMVSLPLLFRVLSKGHSISLAMHYYRLDFSVRRTSHKQIQATRLDVVFLLLVLVFCAGSLAANQLLPFAA